MIKGLTDRFRPPHKGRVRLGEKNEKGYPVKTNYFVLKDAPGLEEIFGANPRELIIQFYSNDPRECFDTSLMWWSKTGLKCRGDGETAERFDEFGEPEPITCTYTECEHYRNGDCKERGILRFIVKESKGLGYYDLVTSSIKSIREISQFFTAMENLKIDYAGADMILRLAPSEVVYEKDGKKHTTTVYTLSLNTEASFQDLLTGKKELTEAKKALPEAKEEATEEKPVGVKRTIDDVLKEKDLFRRIDEACEFLKISHEKKSELIKKAKKPEVLLNILEKRVEEKLK